MKVLVLLLAFLLPVLQVEAQEDCQLRKDEEGIKVFLCETEGSAFKTVKAEFEAKATLKEYAASILDIDSYKYWQHNILNTHVIKKINDNELIYYLEVDTPWPVSHRDLVFRLKMSQDPATHFLQITLEELPDYIPHKAGIIRVPLANELVVVSPIDEQHIRINYEFHVDPGGKVPAFIANMFAAQTPWQTFKNFRGRLQSNKNPNKGVSFINNFHNQ